MKADAPPSRLAVYGTLQPGGPNAHLLDQLEGLWVAGHVRGELRDAGWGAGVGYPGIRLDNDAVPVSVMVLESSALDDEWQRLDDFEGPEYRRVLCNVEITSGVIEAYIYELRDS